MVFTNHRVTVTFNLDQQGDTKRYVAAAASGVFLFHFDRVDALCSSFTTAGFDVS